MYGYMTTRRPRTSTKTCITTAAAVYDYFHYRRHVNNYFPRRPVNVYFHLHRIELVPLRKRTLQRYNDETTARVCMCVV